MSARLEVTWLDGERGVDVSDVGDRAFTLARLRSARLPALRGFVLGRGLFVRATEILHGDGTAMMALPQPVADVVVRALRQLGGPVAVRRSRLPDLPVDAGSQSEGYLHVMHPTDVLEAIRRLWSGAVANRRPVAVVVQRFVTPDVSARLMPAPGASDGALAVESCYGVGDLLAQGLVVPDRHTITADGAVKERHLGRKAQMTIPRTDGDLVRVPVPMASSREYALDDAMFSKLAGLWGDASRALGPLGSLSVALAGEQLSITSAVPKLEAVAEVVLG